MRLTRARKAIRPAAFLVMKPSACKAALIHRMPLAAASCFGDLNITVWDQAVTLPLSSLCQYLAMLGNILVAVSMLMAARIVTRG